MKTDIIILLGYKYTQLTMRKDRMDFKKITYTQLSHKRIVEREKMKGQKGFIIWTTEEEMKEGL